MISVKKLDPEITGMKPRCPNCGSDQIRFVILQLLSYPILRINADSGTMALDDSDVNADSSDLDQGEPPYICWGCGKEFKTMEAVDPVVQNSRGVKPRCLIGNDMRLCVSSKRSNSTPEESS